jgi:phage host-nuclease inhibitor protein Gam
MQNETQNEPLIINTSEAAEIAVSMYVQEKLALAELKAQMEQQIAAVQDSYQSRVLASDDKIETLECAIQVWAETNRASFALDGKEKSKDFLLARVGFRTCPPSVEKAKKDTWEKLAKRLAASSVGKKFLRKQPDAVDKEAILSGFKALSVEQFHALEQCGVRIEQDEVFYIKPKSEIADATVRKDSTKKAA